MISLAPNHTQIQLTPEWIATVNEDGSYYDTVEKVG